MTGAVDGAEHAYPSDCQSVFFFFFVGVQVANALVFCVTSCFSLSSLFICTLFYSVRYLHLSYYQLTRNFISTHKYPLFHVLAIYLYFHAFERFGTFYAERLSIVTLLTLL